MSTYYFHSQANAAHGVIANAALTRKAAGAPALLALIADIESHGAHVTNADQYRALVNYQPAPHADPDPLTTDPADAHEAVMGHAARVNATRTSQAWANYLTQAGRAILASMTTEADTYLDAMRPAFDNAAATITTALGMGLDENTPDTYLTAQATPEQVTAWRAALDASRTLDRIATTRLALSAWLAVAPQANANHASEVPDYTPAFTVTNAPMERDPSPVSPNAIARRWFALQNSAGTSLRLNSISDLDAVGYCDGRSAGVA